MISRRTTVHFFRRIFLVFGAVLLAWTPDSTVGALTVAPPADISNRQKAHMNIIFTGGGSGVTAGQSCSTGDTVSGGISKDFNLGTDPKDRRVNLIKAFMSAYGLTPEQAAGPVGNFMQESGGPHLPPDVNQNDTTGAPPNNTGLGYGWAQWSGGRKTLFVEYMNSKGFVTGDGRATDAADFGYLLKELDSTGYASTIPELKKQTTPEDAAVSFEATFESAGQPEMTNRKKYARQAYDEYTASGQGSTDTSSCGTAASEKFGQIAFPLRGTKKTVLNPGIFHDNTTDVGGHPYIAYDIYANQGTEVVAFAGGTVTYTSVDRCHVKFVTIWNPEANLGVTYMHLSDHIAMGKKVKPGDHVGTIGKGSGDPGCEVEHLHIDVATDKQRQACSREGCSIQDHFRPIGKELYTTYQGLPEG